MKLDVEKSGMFMSAMNDKIALVGGYRSGSSPANTTRLKFLIMDLDKRSELINGGMEEGEANDACISGETELFVEDGSDFDVKGLVNIEVYNKGENNRRKGIGTEVIKALTDTIGTDLPIHDIENNKDAIGFWQAVGIDLTDRFGKKTNRFVDGNIAGTVIKDKIDKIYEIRNCDVDKEHELSH